MLSLKGQIPEVLEWVILGFFNISEFYSLLVDKLLWEEIYSHLDPTPTRVLIDFTRQVKEVYWFPVGEESQIKYAPLSDETAQKRLEIGRAYFTYFGPDLLLDETTQEEKRYFRNIYGLNYSQVYSSKDINFTRYLIQLTTHVSYSEWMNWYSTEHRPDIIQKRIIEMMVHVSGNMTLLKLRAIPRGRQVRYLNVSALKQLLSTGVVPTRFEAVDFVDSVNESPSETRGERSETQDDYLSSLLEKYPDQVRGVNDADFIDFVRKRKVKAVQLLINDKRFGALVNVAVKMRNQPVNFIIPAEFVLRGTIYHAPFVEKFSKELKSSKSSESTSGDSQSSS